jgi:hypothetical protein
VLEDEHHHVARKDSAVEEAVQGRESEPRAGPIHRRLGRAERDLEVAAGVVERPTEELLVHGPKQAGKLVDECREALVQRHSEQLQTTGHFVGAVDEP